MIVCNEIVSNLFICSHSSVCDLFSVVHLHRSRLQLVGKSEKKERMVHGRISFNKTPLAFILTIKKGLILFCSIINSITGKYWSVAFI